MEDVDKRFKDASEKCFDTYTAWLKDKKDSTGREALQEALHELRKVAARMEIEIAVSEGGGTSAKRIPIPAHRSSKRIPDKARTNNKSGNKSGNNNADNSGNAAEGELPSFIKGDDASQKASRKRPVRKPKSDGGNKGTEGTLTTAS